MANQSIQVDVIVNVNYTNITSQINAELAKIEKMIQGAFGNKTILLNNLTIGVSSVKLANNVRTQIQRAINSGFAGQTIKLASASLDSTALMNRAQKLGKQFADESIKSVNNATGTIDLARLLNQTSSLQQLGANTANAFVSTFQKHLQSAKFVINANQIQIQGAINPNGAGGKGGSGNGGSGSNNNGNGPVNGAQNTVNKLESIMRRVTELYRSTDQIMAKLRTADPSTSAFTKLSQDLDASERKLQHWSNVVAQARQHYASFFDGTNTNVNNIKLNSTANKYDLAQNSYTKNLADLKTYTNAVRQQMEELLRIQAQYEAATAKFRESKQQQVGSSQAQTLLRDAQALQQQADAAMRAAQTQNVNATGAAQQRILQLIQQCNAERQKGVNIENQISKSTQRLATDYNNLLARIQRFQNSNAQALKGTEVGTDLNNLIARVNNSIQTGSISTAGLGQIKQDFSEIQARAASATASTQSFGSSLLNVAKSAAQWFTLRQAIYMVWNTIKDMIGNVHELDTAMTELYKVTDESQRTYDTFLDNAAKSATEYGATLTDVVNSTATFARLGYTLDEAFQLSEAATTLATVGDDIDSARQASEDLVSVMKAFDIDAAGSLSIVDKLNELGKVIAYVYSVGFVMNALVNGYIGQRPQG